MQQKKYILFYIFFLSSFVVLRAETFVQENDSLIPILKKEIKKHTGVKQAKLIDSLGKLYNNYNQAGLAFQYREKALNLYNQLGAEEEAAKTSLEVSSLLRGQDFIKVDPFPYIKTAEKYAIKNNNLEVLLKVNFNYAYYLFENGDKNKVKKYFEKALEIATELKDTVSICRAYANLGLVYSGRFRDQKLAREYYKKGYPKHILEKDSLQLLAYYINYANSYQKEGKYRKAITYLDSIKDFKIKKYELGYQTIIYRKYVKCYKALGDYKNAFVYQEKYNAVQDSLNLTKQNIAISDIKTKYETEKKEKENFILKTDLKKKKQTQTILWIVVISSVLIGTIISLLIAKNARRKRQIIQQNQKLKLQQTEKELKQQELNTIDMMIAGQEKERQRLAEDLHDNLGSSLAAIRLNIESLKEENKNTNTDSFSKILHLINEAYQNVRNMAHQKSSGVLASSGLIPAVKRFAKNVSTPNGLKVHVEEFGLDQKLENSLEITIFRIIQELVTNIIKHAEATEANISFTNHNSTLNIIIEDNGKGFDPKTASKNKTGIGLETIEKRIEHLGGNFDIDTHPNRGTSIIINLPI
ncbi:tetratricopeptide repeat-containing sensor histidine kinase [Mesonia aquimarina]|uniref:tetratricopeptide repeat-containing sensor histidine kinase n=1 Tax=Mesonia aquimarina TaxID=1504967 RepID=UPI000EF568CF|nr:sensor histidine kinase [Mesonia aquimarina]